MIRSSGGRSGGRMSRRALMQATIAALGAPSLAGAQPGVAAIVPLRAEGGLNHASLTAFAAARRRAMAVVALHETPARLDAVTRAIERAARGGARDVVAYGEVAEAAILDLASHYPETRFSIIQGEARGPNIASYRVDPLPAAALAGVAAWSLSRARLVGHVGFERSGPALRLRSAFMNGVASVAPAASCLTGFARSEAGFVAMAAAEADVGADVVFLAHDGDCAPAARAAAERGARVIGFGLDWTAGVRPSDFVAAALADPTPAFIAAFVDISTGHWRPDRHRRLEPENGTDRLVLARSVPDHVRRDVALRAKMIANGRIDVTADWSGPEFELE